MHRRRFGADQSSLLHGLWSTPLGQRLSARVVSYRCCTPAESCIISIACHSDESQHRRPCRQTAVGGQIFARPELSPMRVGHLFGACAGRTAPRPPASCMLTWSRTLPPSVRRRSLPGPHLLGVCAGGSRPPPTEHCSIPAPAVGTQESPAHSHAVSNLSTMPCNAGALLCVSSGIHV